MAIFVVNHKVNDFSVWKQAYDAHASTREKFGVKDHFVVQSLEDANNVTVVAEGELERIQEFMNSEELKSVMADAGVIGPPEVFIGDNKL